jgi:hypothetical protein
VRRAIIPDRGELARRLLGTGYKKFFALGSRHIALKLLTLEHLGQFL